MAINVQSNPEVSTASLVGGIVNDAQELFKQQLELFKAELKQDLHRTQEGTTLAIAGTCLSLIGALLLGFAVAHLLFWAWPAVDLWVWYGLVGLAFAGGGAGLLAMVLVRLKKAKPLSETTAGIEENLEWQTKMTRK